MFDQAAKLRELTKNLMSKRVSHSSVVPKNEHQTILIINSCLESVRLRIVQDMLDEFAANNTRVAVFGDKFSAFQDPAQRARILAEDFSRLQTEEADIIIMSFPGFLKDILSDCAVAVDQIVWVADDPGRAIYTNKNSKSIECFLQHLQASRPQLRIHAISASYSASSIRTLVYKILEDTQRAVNLLAGA